jgi:hypothetical protein
MERACRSTHAGAEIQNVAEVSGGKIERAVINSNWQRFSD